MPALFNDEVIIKGLIAQGVAPADAVTYGIIGCVEIGIPGKEQGVTAGGHINAAKALELALNEGRSLITGDLIGWPTPDPATFHGFDDLWQAYKNQIEYLWRAERAGHDCGRGSAKTPRPLPVDVFVAG